ncbi:MAG TPA: radical SAM protein [Planctomycetota bacterium]|jgi:wyosine [tRNA(Phe)-imidazoG37] synthetase (radical SAM superfamily)|nr:radical SAM protein [Planctomycetota bacterium]
MADVSYKEYALSDGVTYGPVKSRRLGASLGVNILPFGVKVCSFNCNYCQCGWTTDTVDPQALAKYAFPSARDVGDGLRKTLEGLKAKGEPLDCITLAGNGEPTLHPDFLAVVKAVLSARDEIMPGVRVDILSNAAHLDRPAVVEGLNLLDARYMKLDAGSEEQFLNMNSPVTEVGIWDVVQQLPKLKDFTIQAMFTHGRRDNTDSKSVIDWINIVKRVKPRSVQIYSVDRFPADKKITKVDRGLLDEIAQALTEQTGIPAEVFG